MLDSTKAAAFNPECELTGDLVLFASLVSGLHYALECFADDWEVAMARFTISESFSVRSVCVVLPKTEELIMSGCCSHLMGKYSMTWAGGSYEWLGGFMGGLACLHP